MDIGCDNQLRTCITIHELFILNVLTPEMACAACWLWYDKPLADGSNKFWESGTMGIRCAVLHKTDSVFLPVDMELVLCVLVPNHYCVLWAHAVNM